LDRQSRKRRPWRWQLGFSGVSAELAPGERVHDPVEKSGLATTGLTDENCGLRAGLKSVPDSAGRSSGWRGALLRDARRVADAGLPSPVVLRHRIDDH